MTTIDRGVVGELGDDGHPLNRGDMHALLANIADDRIRIPAQAWLEAFRLARWLGFSTRTALVQADGAWDRAVEDLAFELEPTTPELN